jgi:hypothetical protein
MHNCKYCYAVFTSEQLLEHHEARHRRQYICKICTQTFPSRFSLFRHTKKDGHYVPKDAAHKLPAKARVAFKGNDTRPPKEFGKGVRNNDMKTMTHSDAVNINRVVTRNTRVVNPSPMASRLGPRIPFRENRILPISLQRRVTPAATVPAPMETSAQATALVTGDPSAIDLARAGRELEDIDLDLDMDTDFTALEKELFGSDSDNEKEKDFNHKR